MIVVDDLDVHPLQCRRGKGFFGFLDRVPRSLAPGRGHAAGGGPAPNAGLGPDSRVVVSTGEQVSFGDRSRVSVPRLDGSSLEMVSQSGGFA